MVTLNDELKMIYVDSDGNVYYRDKYLDEVQTVRVHREVPQTSKRNQGKIINQGHGCRKIRWKNTKRAGVMAWIV